MPSEQDFLQKIEENATRLSQIMASAKALHERATQEAEQTFERKRQEIQNFFEQTTSSAREAYRRQVGGITTQRDETLSKARQEHQRTVTGVESELEEVERTSNLMAAPWDAPVWRGFHPQVGVEVPRLTRVGLMTVQGQFKNIQAPALLPIIGTRNVIIKASGAAKAQALQAMQALMLRLLATLPPGKLRFVLVDPVGLGSNVAGFMKLPDELTGGKAWTEPTHIEGQLADLSAHMETVIQKYLTNRYKTMEDYNVEAGEVAEPYRLLVVANFPVNFTEDSARRLVSIASNGPRTGVYSLIMVDTEQPLPYGFNLADLERAAAVIGYENGRWVWHDDDFQDCLLDLDHLPSTRQFDRIIKATGEAAKQADNVEVPFERVAPPRDEWWQSSTADMLQPPIGRVGATGLQLFELGKGVAHHALVVGRTGSGKSTLLHVIITSLAVAYSPEEIELYLVDFKKGVEFKDYAVHQLPHARVIAIQSEREFGLSVLRGLDAEIQRRGDLFRDVGCTGLQEYREKTGEKLPRVLLLVDEFQEFFAEDDSVAAQSALILDRLVRQGRSFGMHALLASQTLAGTYNITRATTDQMAVRIALQCSDADSRLILSDDNPAARLLERPGEAIYNAQNGLVEGNSLFQVFWLANEQHDGYLERLREMAEHKGYVPSQPQIVFEGNAPAEIEKNRELHDLLEAPEWPAPARQVSVWLGEPVEIKPHTAARFRRQSCSNLLVVGQDEASAVAMFTSGLVSLAAQYRPEDALFYVIDLGSADAPWEGSVRALGEDLPHRIKVVRRRRDVLPLVDEIHQLVVERGEAEDEPTGPPVYFEVIGLQQARDLRSEDPYRPSEAATKFLGICREGPDVGVHTLIWCNTYGNLERVLTRQGVAEFDMRVAFPMSTGDSDALLDSPAAAKLGPYRALLYDEERIGQLEKFRPYALPPQEWLEWAGEQLKRR